MFGTVGQLDSIFSILDAAKFPDAGLAHDSRAMDAHEFLRIEFLTQRAHGFAQQMSAAADMQFGVVTCAPDPVDLVGQYDLQTCPGTYVKARRVAIRPLGQPGVETFRQDRKSV